MNSFADDLMVRRTRLRRPVTREQEMKLSCRGLRRHDPGRGRHDTWRILLSIVLLFGGALCTRPAQAGEAFLHHNLRVILSPVEHRLAALDSITLPNAFPNETTFSLHAGLTPTSPTPGVRIVKLKEKQGAVPTALFNVILPPGLRTFMVTYYGSIHHRIEQYGGEQASGIQDTPGIISADGVVLSGASSWYPDFEAGLVTFDLEVGLPPGWDAVSQGERTVHVEGESATVVAWISPEPQNEIHIVAGKFTEYTGPANHAQAMVFLRAPDEAMANRYLDATTRYLEMYSSLIGPYPYKKFALVENFWETGFGMPSFTLLGPKVIRLPFIITTSYPHEILHNWWGNSVLPDYEKGNWSEGLTAYLSDHLMKELEGKGAEYRLDTLQKYADYVLGSRDFPLTQFQSRHSSSTEAIGYGKSLMFFHMLRRELGDDLFRQGIRKFFNQYKFRFADFTSIRTSFETVSGRDLRPEFEQWVSRTGAPMLRLGDVAAANRGDQYLLTFMIRQVQPGDAYRLHLPLAVTMEGQDQAFQTSVDMTKKDQEVTITVPARPLRLDIDPEFYLFRRLDREELPPAISQALGAKKMLVILPSRAYKGLLQAYQMFSKSLEEAGPEKVEVMLDTAIRRLPDDRTITILGWENRFLGELISSAAFSGVAVTPQSVLIDRTEVPRKDHSIVLTARLPKNRDLALLFIASDLAEALPGLGRKLPHYHKYSYLAFKGQEPENVAKGRWPVLNSPMTVYLPAENGARERIALGKLAPRAPLATLAPAFSKGRMPELSDDGGKSNDQGQSATKQ